MPCHKYLRALLFLSFAIHAEAEEAADDSASCAAELGQVSTLKTQLSEAQARAEKLQKTLDDYETKIKTLNSDNEKLRASDSKSKEQLRAQESESKEKLRAQESESKEKLRAQESQSKEKLRAQESESKEKLRALEAENKELRKATEKSGAMPYASSAIADKAFEALMEAGEHYGILKDVDVIGTTKSLVQNSAALASAAAAISAQAAEVSMTTAKLAADASKTVYSTASDLHKTHLEPHIGQHLKAGQEIYTTNVKPHLDTAVASYQDTVIPQVSAFASQAATSSLAAVQQGRDLIPVVTQTVSDAYAQVSNNAVPLMATVTSGVQNASGPYLQQFEVTVGGKTILFPRGYLDLILAVTQVGAVFFISVKLSYKVAKFLWKFFLRGLLWKVVVKLCLQKIVIGTTARITKICWKTFWFLFRTVFRLVRLVVSLVICVGVGSLLEQGVEMGLDKGLQMKLDLYPRLGLVAFFALLTSCCCRCGRRKKGKDAKGKDAKGKDAGKKGQQKAPAPAPAKKADDKKNGKGKK